MTLNFNFQVPIKEQGFLDNDFIINGVAINATTTANNHRFLAEELKLSAGTLKGVPLLIDHRNEVSAIMGRVISGDFIDIEERVDFKAIVIDEKIKELIKDGRLNSVSIGASIEEIEEEDGVLIPRGITFKELSLVAVPADDGATFQIAMNEAYSHLINKREEKTMEKETKVVEQDEEVKAEEPVVEVTPEPEAKTETPDATTEMLKTMSKQMKELANEVKTLKTMKESDEDEKHVEHTIEPVAKPEEVIDEEEEIEEKAGYKIVQGHGSLRGGSFTLIR